MDVANISLIVLSDGGDRTVVEASYHPLNDELPTTRATGSSGREPGDKTDRAVGEALAVQRALVNLGKKLERQAAGRMKHREDIARHHQEIKDSKGQISPQLQTLLEKYGGALYGGSVQATWGFTRNNDLDRETWGSKPSKG